MRTAVVLIDKTARKMALISPKCREADGRLRNQIGLPSSPRLNPTMQARRTSPANPRITSVQLKAKKMTKTPVINLVNQTMLTKSGWIDVKAEATVRSAEAMSSTGNTRDTYAAGQERSSTKETPATINSNKATTTTTPKARLAATGPTTSKITAKA